MAAARTAGQLQPVLEAFRKHDLSGTGLITRGDLARLFQAIDRDAWCDANIDTVLAAADAGDENVDYEALVQWLAASEGRLGPEVQEASCADELEQKSAKVERPHYALRSIRGTHVLKAAGSGSTVVGRKDPEACAIVVAHPSVSSRHAELEVLAEPDGDAVVVLRDLGSMNGTFSDDEHHPGTRVQLGGKLLAIGDYIRFGFCPLDFHLEVFREAGDDADAQLNIADDAYQTRRAAQLKHAETSYLGWLSEVGTEYRAVRQKTEVEGLSKMAELPSLAELEEACSSFCKRPNSQQVNMSRGGSSPGDLGADEGACPSYRGPSTAEIEAEEERLAGRSWEVSSVLRLPLGSEDDVRDAECHLAEALTLVTETLPDLARRFDSQTCGPVFQSLLASCDSQTSGHAMRPGEERKDATMSLEKLDEKEIRRCAASVQDLCALLRIKIEDDGDLGLARAILEDSRQFFLDVAQCAKWKGTSAYVVFTECNA